MFRGRRGYRTRYSFKRGTAEAYTTEVVIVCKYRGKKRYKRRRGVQYFAYAVYRLGRMEARAVFELYRRRFGIETGYRQMHQVRARTCSRNPALRLLLLGLAVLIVNYWVLLRQAWVVISHYGIRHRVRSLTLERVADAILEEIKQLLGITRVFEIAAVLHGS